jgi:hypothetical protein
MEKFDHAAAGLSWLSIIAGLENILLEAAANP